MARERKRRIVPQTGTGASSAADSDSDKFKRQEAARQKQAARIQRSHLKRDKKKEEGDK